MPYTLPPITLTENVTSNVNIPGNLGSVTYLKMVNASPYLVQINNLLGGSDYMQPGEANVWPVPGLTTAVQVTPLPFVSASISSSAPTSVIVVTWYLEGEQPTGTYPVNFGLLTFNGGNIGVASQLINDGNTAGTRIIEATPATEPQSYIIIDNDGTFNVYYKSPSLGIVQSFISGPTPDAQYGFGFQVSNGLAVFANTMIDGNAATPIRTDGNGNITSGNSIAVNTLKANAPVTLISGHQETGFAGLQGTANAGNNISLGVNFKTVMTNIPSSLTLTTSFSGNTTVQTATGITKYGFWLSVKATANGDTYWAGTYTTVGNCLLAVDTTAQTFDHHCDACGAVHLAQSFSTALIEYTPLLALSYLCPACGARDCFNAAMIAADEADTTPQGSGAYATTRGAQATLIRQLMTALGLAVAA